MSSIEDFILFDGKPPLDEALKERKDTTLAELREQYEAAYSNGAIEANTLYTIRLHLDRIQETLGKKFILSGLTLGKLQSHIDHRSKHVAPVTIKKEIDSFRSVWNYGLRSEGWCRAISHRLASSTPRLPKNFRSWPGRKLNAASGLAAIPISSGNASISMQARLPSCSAL